MTLEQIIQLKDLFIKFLTENSETQDRRRKEFNQAIFNAETGRECWSNTSIDMVLDKFDKAAEHLLKNQNK